MKHPSCFSHALSVLLVLLLGVTRGFGQATPPKDEYAPARKIIADLDSIVTPNGVQESMAMTIGGVRQWVYVRG